MATDPVIPWSPAPTIPGSVRTPGGGLIAPSAPRLVSPFGPQARPTLTPTKRTTPKLKKVQKRQEEGGKGMSFMLGQGVKLALGGASSFTKGAGGSLDAETEEIGRMISNAAPGMATFLGGLARDLVGITVEKGIMRGEYDANTAQELWHSLGRTAGLIYDDRPDRGWFARVGDYADAVREGAPISSMLVEDAGNITLAGSVIAKGLGTAGRAARVGAEARAMAGGAKNVGAAETGFVSEAAKAAAPRLSRLAEAGVKGERAVRKAIRPADYLLSLPIKPYVYGVGQLGKIVRNGAYFGSLHTGWGKKAADAYIQELRDLQSSPGFDPALMSYEVGRLRQKISRHQKLSMTWQARRAVVAAARKAEAEQGKQARTVINSVKNAPHANKKDPVTDVVYGDELSPDENVAVIAIINGTADLVDGMVNEFGESVENIATLSRYNDYPGYSPTPEGLNMAVRFLKPGGGGLSPMQYERIAAVVDSVVQALQLQAADKAAGIGRRYPLQPHNFVPVPVVQYLLDAVKREAAATRDPYLLQVAEFIQNNQGLWDLPVDNPVRIQMLQFLIKNMPESILYDSSIYPSAMRPLVEMYKRYRRNLERRAIAAGEGGDMPMGPRAGKPGAASRYAAQARLRASAAKAKIDKLSERIARLEEQHSRGVDTLRRMEMVERIANGESLESIAAEYGVRPEDLQKIYTGSKVGQTRRRYEEARDAARALLQQAIDAGVVRIENGAMVYTTRNELTAQLEAAVADAQALNQEYRDLIESITQEKVAAARELEDLADEIDDTSEEMFDAEDDFVADGGDITELEQPDTSLEELRGETPEAALAREAVSLRDEVEASLTTDEISREVDALRKKVAFLEERAAGAESAPRGDFVPRQPTADDVVAAVDELLKAGKITEANAEKIKYDLQPHGYKPYASSAERSRNIDNEAFSESKSVNGIEVENIDGDLWWTDGYVIARVSDTPILNSKNNPVAAPGRYRANSGNKQTTIKSEGYAREGDVVRNMKGLVETFPKDSEMIVAVPDETYVSWIKTGKGETARTEVVFIRAADGTYLTADADFIRMFDDGNTTFYIPQNPNKGKLNIIVAKRNGKTVGYIASIRVGDAMSAPPPIEKIVADNASVSPDLIGLGDELLKKLGLRDPRAGISVQGSAVVASKDLKQARERLKRFENLLESRTKAEAKLKPVKRAPEKGVEPTGYTIDAEQLFDPYDGWEQYYAQEDLSIPMDEFSNLVNEKRIALAIHGDLKSVELAISDPEQYGASVDQSLVNSVLRGRKKDSALKSIREDINVTLGVIAELESAIRDAIEPYEAARGRGRLAPPEQPATRPAKKPAKLTAAQKKSPAAGVAEQARRVQKDFFETYKTGNPIKGLSEATYPTTLGPNIYVTGEGKRNGILVSERPGKKSATGAVDISIYIDDNANIADVISVFEELQQKVYDAINDLNNGKVLDRYGKPRDYQAGPVKEYSKIVGNFSVSKGSKPFNMKAINQAINAYRQALLAGQEAITTGTRTAAVEPPSARLVQPEAAPSALSPEADLRARLADVEARMEAYMDSDEYYSNEGSRVIGEMEAEAASIRRQIEQISQPVAESDVVFFREEYGGVPGFWKRGNVEWYTRSEATDQGVAAGYYTPENVNKGDIEPDRLADDTLSDIAEKNPDAGLFIKIDKAPKGFVAGAGPQITIAVPSTWQELRTMIDSVVDYLDGGREGRLADNLRKSVSVQAVYGTNDYKKLIPELKRLRKYIDGKIAEGETTIYTPRAADTTQRLAQPPATLTARPTNLRSVPVKQLPAAHAEIADPSPGFTVEVLGPNKYGNGTTTGGIEFATSDDPLMNRFGYELFDESTFESAVKALDYIINATQKYIDRGDYTPSGALGLFDATTGNKFYAQLGLDGSTPDGLDAVYAILDEAQRQRDILTGKAAEQPTRPAEVRPRPEIVDRDIQSQVFADDAVVAIAPRLAEKVRVAQTASEKIKALDELMKAVAKSQERWTEYQEALARNEKRRQGILALPGRISTAEKAREQAEAVMQEQIAKAVAVETSPEYQRLTSMPATLPLDIAMDPTRQGLTEAGFGEIQLPDGSAVRAMGPIYVPSQAPSTVTGLKGKYTVREGLPGFIPDISERQRIGDREMIWRLDAVAARIAGTAGRMSLNESWRMFVGQHGRTLEEMIEIVNERINAANKRDGGNRPLYDLEQMREIAYQRALNMPTMERQARYAPETLPEGVTPETFVPGYGAMAPGVVSPETNLQRMANKEFGKMIIDILRTENFEAIDPWNRARATYSDFELANPEMMYMDRTTLDLASSLSAEQNPQRDIPVLDQLTQVNKFFKSSTLALSVMWQIGDFTTALIIARLTGVNVRTLIRRMKEVYQAEYGSVKSMFDINAPDIPGTPLAELATSSGVQDVSASMSERQFLRGFKVSPQGRLLERGMIGKLGGTRVQRFADRSFKFNETINRITRHAFFLEKLDNLLRENGNTLDGVVRDGSWRSDPEIRAAVEKAAATANQWLGDFADLSIAEKRYVSLVFPFWAWTKHIHKVFYALGRDHPESLKWYIYMGTLGSDLENDPLDLRLGSVPVFGGAASVNFLNPLADVFEGPFVRFVRGEPEGLGRAAGPVPRIAGAALGIDIARMQRLSRPAGTGMYSKTGMPKAGLGNLLDPSTYPQVAGYALQQFPIATRLAAFGPVGETLPGTTLALGPVSRYSTGEARRRGSGEIITQPGGRLGALGRLFSLPLTPSRSDEQINDVLKSAERRLKSVERAKKRAELGG